MSRPQLRAAFDTYALRTRYNEVMDILNPPKEEQSLDTDGGDAVQYQRRAKDNEIRIRLLIFIGEFKQELSPMLKHGLCGKQLQTAKNVRLFIRKQ